MRAARAARIVVAASLGVAALVGCADSGSSSGSVIEPTAAPSSAKPTPPAPAPEASQQDKAGAAAFTEYWFALLSYGVQTGEVDKLRAASDAKCTECAEAIGVIQENYNDGGSLQGGVYTVREANTIEDFAGQVMTVAVSFDRSPRDGTSPLGQPRGRLDGKSFADCDVRVLWTSAGWKVRGVDSVEQLI
ncbi:hypothetical protein GCM10020369_82010 [Cryptosporangium minutisporangium]|uniref:DUF6318 domain-containing protein n=2 Tax=Cryptosporangium minutisporangium TaxID=113569 RepID=A0ABP6TCC0_9ACTN